MRRTKGWWSKFTKDERSYIVYFERHQGLGGRSPYLPDDCAECGVCGCPIRGWGACSDCYDAYEKILNKPV